MTWTKLGVEFFDELAHFELSDAAVRTHAEAIGWLYRLESDDLVVKRVMLRRFAGTADPEAAAAELVGKRLWRSTDSGWVVTHHAEVIRQSIAAQRIKRETERDRQRRKRGTPAVGANVGTNVGDESHPTQTDSHTDKQALMRDEVSRPADGGIRPVKCTSCESVLTNEQRGRGLCGSCWMKTQPSERKVPA